MSNPLQIWLPILLLAAAAQARDPRLAERGDLNLMRKYLNEAQTSFSVRGARINPRIVEEFENLLSDLDLPQRVSIDLTNAIDSNRYFGKVEKVGGGCRYQREEEGYYQYTPVGRLENGLYIVLTEENGGGTLTVRHLHAFQFRLEKTLACPAAETGDEGDKPARTLIARPYHMLVMRNVFEASPASLGGEAVIHGNEVTVENKAAGRKVTYVIAFPE